MGSFESRGIFDAKTGKVIDVKKPAIVDVAGGEPPVGTLVVLAFEQMMEC